MPRLRYKGASVHPQRVRRPQSPQQPLLQEVDQGASVPLRVAPVVRLLLMTAGGSCMYIHGTGQRCTCCCTATSMGAHDDAQKRVHVPDRAPAQ